MNKGRILRLDQLNPADQARFGGKAAHLAALARAGLSVPPGFCLPSSSFRSFLEDNTLLPAIEAVMGMVSRTEGESLEALEALSALRERILAAPLPPPFVEEIRRAYSRLAPGETPLVAVRSSARSEDSREASFAGQYDSILNVQGLEPLLLAIKEGWAGYFSERAFRYRRHCGQDRLSFDMGLLVQQMIEPEVSGVLFTTNPMTGSHREMLLEAGLGLGEAYVSGHLTPDSFYLSRPRAAWWPGTVTVMQTRIEPKLRRLACVPRGSGLLKLVDVEPERREAPALTGVQALAIGQLGLQIERLFGAPQDIEWAIDATGRIFILQARPITTRPRLRYERPASVLWTQRFSGERWTEPSTTLGWSVIQPILHHFIYFEDAAAKYLQGTQPTRVVSGYPYFNITIFRHLLWKLPGFAPPQFILEFFPEEEQEAILAAPYIVPNIRLVGSIFSQVFRQRRWRRYHWNFLTNHHAWDEYLPEFLAAIDAMPEEASSARDAREVVRKGQQLIQDYVKIHLLSLLFANLYYQLLAGRLHHWVGDGSQEMLSRLVAGLPGENKTVETNVALWQLKELARAWPALHARLEADPPPGREELTRLPGGPAFVTALEAFLRDYGHRSSASWEIFSLRWSDDPDEVLHMVRGLLEAGRDPIEAEAQRSEARHRAEATIRERLGVSHPLRRLFFNHVLRSTQRYMILRENQRFYFDKLLLKIKRAFESMGQHLVQEGQLSRPEDLRLLTLEEVDRVLGGQLRDESLATLLRSRREQYERDLAASHPVFLEGDQALSWTPASSRKLSGLGISPGRITGPVRVIHHPREMGKLKKGDILVARATDPGWTPMFLTAGGLVAELGGLLSHSAVVAREYNLPAVANIVGATSLLKDGQEVTLDGSRGVVYLH